MIPELWVKSNSVTQNIVKHHFDKFKHLLKWKKNETILEFGAADGNTSVNSVLPMFPKDYKEYILSDISPNMVQHMKNNLNVPKSKIIHHDIATERLQDEYKSRFDHIFGFLTIHVVPNPRQAFININKMLKPGGQVFVSFFDRTPIDHAFHKLLQYPKWSRYGHMLSAHYYSENVEKSYREDVEAAGFKNYVFNIENDADIIFGSDEDRRALYVSVNQVLPRVPEELKEEYIETYLKEAEDGNVVKYTEKDGKRISYVKANFIFIVAEK